MDGFSLLILAFGLGCDSFSVAVAAGLQGISARRVFRLSWHFGLFQFLMPLAGLALGKVLAAEVSEYGSYVAGVVLVLVGGRIIYGGFKGEPGSPAKDMTRGLLLVGLSVSVSIDALAAGFGLGLVGANLIVSCAVIGLASFLMTMAGMTTGAFLPAKVRNYSDFIGGTLIILVGANFML